MSRASSRKAKYYYDEPFAEANARQKKRTTRRYFEASFHCQHCGALVSADPLSSGVLNRNHCPYCLWSRHVDLYQSGDRLCACRGNMQPIGLTLKQSKNKYAQHAGELMLVHQCVSCQAYSINRIAADDSSELLLGIYQFSLSISANIHEALCTQKICMLAEEDVGLVMQQLYGKEAVR